MILKASLLIPVFNGLKNLDNCFKSLIDSQELKNSEVEIIFIDDGSFDGTSERLKEFKIKNKDLNILIIKNEINKGLRISLNKGISKSSGEYIFRLDIDDLWVNGRLKTSLDVINTLQKKDKKFVLLGSFMKGISGRNYYCPIEVNNLYQLLFSSCVFHPTWCISSKIAKQYTYEMESPFDDYYLILRLILDNFKIFNFPQNLVIYNDSYTPDRITFRTANSRNIIILKIKFYILQYLMFSLLVKKDKKSLKFRLLNKCSRVILKQKKTNLFFSKIAWLINTILYKIYFIFYSFANFRCDKLK